MAAGAPTQLKTICAWCLTVIADGPADAPVSHGICQDCIPKFEAGEKPKVMKP